MFNLPNLLTALRILIIPVFGYYLCVGSYITAAVLFLVGGLTDVLDGYVARKYNLITAFGKIADPVADKLMQLTALTILALQHKISIIILAVIIAKELLMGAGSILLYKRRKYVVAANWYGKLSTIIFYMAIVMEIFEAPFADIFIIIALILAVFALVMYALNYKRINTSNSQR